LLLVEAGVAFLMLTLTLLGWYIVAFIVKGNSGADD
jgi:hypothetical protein